MKLLVNPTAGDVYRWDEGWKVWLSSEGVPRGQTAHWDWLGKMLRVGPEASTMLIALVDDDETRCHGLMLIRWPLESRLAPGRSCVHVDYLEIAPWNRSNHAAEREFEGMGALLMAHAVMASEDLALEGRVGLCSLPQAEGFYHHIGLVAHGMGKGQDVRLRYFEFAATAAARFVNRIMGQGVTAR